jgi:hypothetical protein
VGVIAIDDPRRPMSRFACLAVSLFALVLTAPGCAEAWNVGDADAALTISTGDAALVLDVVNYPGTSTAVLDEDAGLDSRAAANIAAHRAGADGVTLTADDNLFDDVAELDAIPYVGALAFDQLIAYAHAHPAPAAETVEGVLFHGWESEAVVWGVNNATVEELDVGAALESRAAQNLVARRPFASVTAMGPVAYVGVVALGALRDYADVWFAEMHDAGDAAPALAGTFDGVAFDEATAQTALEIANGATSAQLTAHGITAAPAAAMVAARPYATLAAVAAVSGIGSATMQALHGYAQSGAWAPAGAGAACVTTFQDAVQPHLADVLLMSESDRPLTIVAFPGAGATAPTAASVLALAGAPAGSTAELRDAANYFANLEPASDTADAAAAAAIQAAFGSLLTDVVYVAVIPPAGTPDHALVQSYLVGRTSCGDVVGLVAISVET